MIPGGCGHPPDLVVAASMQGAERVLPCGTGVSSGLLL